MNSPWNEREEVGKATASFTTPFFSITFNVQKRERRYAK